MKKVLFILLIITANTGLFAQNWFSFRKPENKMDSIALNVQYTKLCLGRFYDKHKEGSYFNLLGGGITTIGLIVNFNENKDNKGYNGVNYALIGIGSAICILGTITIIDSYKWINRASFRPILTPNGAGVIVTF